MRRSTRLQHNPEPRRAPRGGWVRLLAVVVLCSAPTGFAGEGRGRSVGGPVEQWSAGADPSAQLWRDEVEALARGGAGERVTVPRAYRFLALDLAGMRELLGRAPVEAARGATPLVVALPHPEGRFERFRVVEAPVMDGSLASRYPEIRTFSGQGIDDPTASLRLDVTPLGFHALVLSPQGSWYIDPWRRGDTEHYQSYLDRDKGRAEGGESFSCLVSGDGTPMGVESVAAGVEERVVSSAALLPLGDTLRTYRLAMAATGEYTTTVCSPNPPAKSCGMAAIVTTVNRVVGIYEREVAVRMVLVANNDAVVYTNGATDPYTNSNGSTMLGQNQTNLDTVIGSANYDIGHVVSTGGGGVAYVGVPCRSGWKARGVTGSPNPVGDAFDVDYVAHEMGHQFGALHTFNGTTGNCGGGNRSAESAYEPGSGSTIMAYAGICGAEDLQPHSDPYFHTRSFDEIRTYITAGSGDTCPVKTSTGNSAPTVDPGPSFTIPKQTPFTLTGSATDPEGDPLTFCWEEFDLGAQAPPNTDVAAVRPIFRSFNPTTSPSRTFPRLADILSGSATLGESMSTRTRTMTFRLTVRDNRAGGGGVDWAATTVDVVGSAGPFAVTQPGSGTTWNAGSCQTVTWDVAGTDAAPISCAAVDILLSTDGGQTFPYTLATATPNDGQEAVNLPLASTPNARIKVACSSSIFFDISNPNFTLAPSPGNATLTVTKTGSGSGTVQSQPAGISCGATCTAALPLGACVTLTASAAPGSVFDGWSGGGCSGTGSCTLSLAANADVAAAFTATCSPLVLTGQTVSGTESWEACGIVAGPAFEVTGTGNATLRATTSVVLRNGFAVLSGGTLTIGHV